MASQSSKKREIIIISLTVLALLYGVFDYVTRTMGKNKLSGGDEIQVDATFSLVDEELASISVAQQESKALEIINAASVAWPDGVFVDIVSYVDRQEEEGTLSLADDALIYSGYMTMGEKILAVINNIEYQVGDMVEGFFLKEIDPMEIVVVKNGRPARVPFKRIDEP